MTTRLEPRPAPPEPPGRRRPLRLLPPQGAAAGPARPSERGGYVHRARILLGALLLTALAFHQDPGGTVSDTKIDLTQAPLRFLGRALQLWEPDVAFGQLQNQAYGYLFPMGPFFALGDAVGLTPYAVGRAWWAVLLVTAYLGVIRLARALDIGSPLSALIGGLAYALSPRMLTVLGPISSEAAPMALLPWALLPLVLVTSGRLDARRGALLSGLAVLFMGGVNAVATLAVLPLPALWILARSRGRERVRLAGWWVVGLVLATLWWVLPLLLLGQYSFPFLDYVEGAASTTSRTSLTEVLRGSSHWVSYVEVAGRPWWRAGHLLATSPVAVVETAVLAALGLVGLARRDMPSRKVLTGALLIGLLVITFGYVGPLAGPLAEPLRAALDASLAPFRNIHKFEPLLRLPLCLGLAHLLAALAVGWRRYVGFALAVLVMLGTAAPALAGNLAPEGSYVEVPGYWRQAARWLSVEGAESRTLVVPGDGFGQFLWGRTVDEPIQPYATSAWAVRQQAGPISSDGTTRLLDAVETQLASGRPSPGLAAYLARAGISHVLVRNDLAWTRSGAPRPGLVRAAVAGSPGLTLAAGFGRRGPSGWKGDIVNDAGLTDRARPVEIYRVAGAGGRVTTYPVEGAGVVSGATDALLQLADRDLLDPHRALLLAGDRAAEDSGGPAFATDSFRHREVAFGAIRDNASETLPQGPVRTTGTRRPDFLPVAPAGHQTVATWRGVRDVQASTSASDPSAVVDRSVARHPSAALDGDERTAWLSGTVSGPGRQWWQVRLHRPQLVDSLTVRLATSRFARAPVTEIAVTTDGGTVRTSVGPGRPEVVRLAVPAGPTDALRITATRFGRDGVTRGSLGLAEVVVPGLHAERTLQLPDDLGGRPAVTVLLDASAGGRTGCVVLDRRPRCSRQLVRSSEEPHGLDRGFVLPGAVPGEAVSVTARSTVAGAALPFTLRTGRDGEPELPAGQRIGVTASSQYVDDPADSAAAAFDDDPRTSWLASPHEAGPALQLHWQGSREVGSVRVRVDRRAAASRPTRVRVTGDGGVAATVRLLPAGGGWREGSFPAITTTGLEVSFPDLDPVVSKDPYFGELERRPVGVAELDVPAVSDLLDLVRHERVDLGCTQAAPFEVDGRAVRLGVVTTRRALVLGEPVRLRPCEAGAAELSSGQHRLVARTGALAVQQVTLGERPAAAPAGTRGVVVTRWGDEHREVTVAAGEPAYLALTENLNAGWHATLRGRELVPARLDGWRQAWVLPAGEGGTVTLSYEPATTYRGALAVGGCAALLLLGLLARRPRPSRTMGAAREGAGDGGGWVLAAVASLAGLALLAGPWGLAAAAAGIVVVHRRPDVVPYVAGGALALAGLVSAWHLRWPMPWSLLPSTTAQALALTALGVLVAEVFLPRLPPRRDGRVVGPDEPPVAPPRGASAPPPPG